MKCKSDVPYQILKLVQLGLDDSSRLVFRLVICGPNIHRLIRSPFNVITSKAKGKWLALTLALAHFGLKLQQGNYKVPLLNVCKSSKLIFSKRLPFGKTCTVGFGRKQLDSSKAADATLYPMIS